MIWMLSSRFKMTWHLNPPSMTILMTFINLTPQLWYHVLAEPRSALLSSQRSQRSAPHFSSWGRLYVGEHPWKKKRELRKQNKKKSALPVTKQLWWNEQLFCFSFIILYPACVKVSCRFDLQRLCILFLNTVNLCLEVKIWYASFQNKHFWQLETLPDS